MKKFEYQIITYPMDKKTSLIAMQDDLNARGKEGWEVVSVSSSEFANIGHTAFLKRAISYEGGTS
ncbi:DUF4177 domain-containing protein [Phaeobacter gallaeciensis]|uniref:DUF4177 domain-containing protein n=1 Tax=Phaeobacter gallaeciensis TaxID=60890 RepID=A0ABD4XDX4_9RHOB|nr:DUF4177 domain-containing protein [Phaeobacter gallaeciensis]MDE4142187.1 DUF4177 domain-containing protein [Phaeobacter gallaeciensis]MDE4146617.1 DUF4177 domain-containing protein [Phaeobacter gallaeciensis]MDE4150572.1 DUF4177 domain-containing protein [Phaeobacter gallaeciensis]MDE4154869.1 DUF4177 domain-containing protein [Phaeobacter gallaeciensis]MDE4159241.1 DUF4177 domain-containing protein [Phaeobacter gallaeciensis]